MKRMLIVFSVFTAFFVFSLPVNAENVYSEQESLWYEGLYDAVDSDTAKMLSELGIEEIDPDALMNISPEKVFTLLFDIITGRDDSPVAATFSVLAVMIISTLICTLLASGGQLKEMCETVGTFCIMFSVILSVSSGLTESLSAVEATKDYMLCLLPVFCGVVAFSGNPSLALSFNTVMLGFAETVSVGFSEYIPPLSAVGTALSASSVINPFFDLSAVVKLINKGVTLVLSFVSAVFVAVLSIKGTIAGAADTVGLKGLKFIVGNSVPVVGSAIGDALNTLSAGLGLIKNTAGIFCIIVLLIINVPSLLRLIIRKICLYFLSVCAGMLGNSKAEGFITALNGLYSVIISVISFNMFVFVIGIMIVLITGKGM